MTSLFSPEVINALKPAVNCTKEVFPAQGGVLLGTPFNGLIMLYFCPTFRICWLSLMAVLEKTCLFSVCWALILQPAGGSGVGDAGHWGRSKKCKKWKCEPAKPLGREGCTALLLWLCQAGNHQGIRNIKTSDNVILLLLLLNFCANLLLLSVPTSVT